MIVEDDVESRIQVHAAAAGGEPDAVFGDLRLGRRLLGARGVYSYTLTTRWSAPVVCTPEFEARWTRERHQRPPGWFFLEVLS